MNDVLFLHAWNCYVIIPLVFFLSLYFYFYIYYYYHVYYYNDDDYDRFMIWNVLIHLI